MKLNLIHHKISHLTNEEIEALITRYYGGENLQVLISEYNIKTYPSGLAKLFPPVMLENKFCLHCKLHLYQPRNNRTDSFPKEAYCLQYKHIDSDNASLDFENLNKVKSKFVKV